MNIFFLLQCLSLYETNDKLSFDVLPPIDFFHTLLLIKYIVYYFEVMQCAKSMMREREKKRKDSLSLSDIKPEGEFEVIQ